MTPLMAHHGELEEPPASHDDALMATVERHRPPRDREPQRRVAHRPAIIIAIGDPTRDMAPRRSAPYGGSEAPMSAGRRHRGAGSSGRPIDVELTPADAVPHPRVGK